MQRPAWPQQQPWGGQQGWIQQGWPAQQLAGQAIPAESILAGHPIQGWVSQQQGRGQRGGIQQWQWPQMQTGNDGYTVCYVPVGMQQGQGGHMVNPMVQMNTSG